MPIRKTFEYSDDVLATNEILDRLARMVWEREVVSQEVREKVHGAKNRLLQEMLHASRDLPNRQTTTRVCPPNGSDVDGDQWRNFTLERLAAQIVSRDVGSVPEAFLKASPVLETIGAGSGDKSRGFVFRGQRNIAWELVPKLGRHEDFLAYLNKVGEGEFLSDRRTKVSSFERDLLDNFKSDWDSLTSVDPLDRKILLSRTDASWWFRLQHYSENRCGTRLLDVTSSIPAALLFACLDWNSGLVDDETDGVLYLFNEGMNANVLDFLPGRAIPTKDDELFENYPDAPVFVLNPPHNERSKAQSGAFLWWPKFWQPYPGQIFFLRVLREKKQDIARELLRMNFGPKDVVRGDKGQENERQLRKSLGLSSRM